MRQTFSCSLLQYHDMTVEILHLQLSLTKHKAGIVKSLCICPSFLRCGMSSAKFVCHDIYPGHYHFINFERQVVQQYWEDVPLLIAVEKAAGNLPGKFLRLKNFRIPVILQPPPRNLR